MLARSTVAASLYVAGALASAAPERGDAADAVRMPAFTATETREGLPWKYGAMPGYEVLSLPDREKISQLRSALAAASAKPRE